MDHPGISIFDYLNYRDFLKDFYKEQKRKHFYFSLRYIAQKTGLDVAHVARVFGGKRHLSEKSVAAFVKLCGFDDRERKYFEALTVFNTARGALQSRQAFETLLSLSGSNSKILQPEQYEFYTTWRHTAIRALIGMKLFKAKGDYKRIGDMLSPPSSAKLVRQSVALLVKAGLVTRDRDGFLRVTDVHITTGPQWHSLAVQAFQAETMELARQSLTRHDRQRRDISTVTIGIRKDRMEEFRERIADFRQSIIKLSEEITDPDDVYQFNIQLFPLTQCDSGEAG